MCSLYTAIIGIRNFNNDSQFRIYHFCTKIWITGLFLRKCQSLIQTMSTLNFQIIQKITWLLCWASCMQYPTYRYSVICSIQNCRHSISASMSDTFEADTLPPALSSRICHVQQEHGSFLDPRRTCSSKKLLSNVFESTCSPVDSPCPCTATVKAHQSIYCTQMYITNFCFKKRSVLSLTAFLSASREAWWNLQLYSFWSTAEHKSSTSATVMSCFAARLHQCHQCRFVSYFRDNANHLFYGGCYVD